MKKVILLLLFFILLLAGLIFSRYWFFSSAKAQVEPQIIINEIMYNPHGTDTDHEWVEVLNTSTSTSYIIGSTWRFSDGSNHLLNLTRGTSTISAGSFAIIAANADVFIQDYPSFSGNLFDSVMNLNNTQDEVRLSLDSGQTFFNSVSYQSALGGNDNGYTLEKDGELFRQSFVLGGTPGQANSTVAVNPPDDNGGSNEATTTPPVFGNDDNGQTPTSTSQDNNSSNNSNNQIVVQNYSNQIIINEVLPDPLGSDTNDEFIELYNRSTFDVDLNNWQLGDASAKRYSINHQDYSSTVIPSLGYFVVYSKDSSISLNNSGDSVKLFQPNGHLLEQVDYGKALTGYAYMKDGGAWLWTENPTPGQRNLFITSTVDDEVVAHPATTTSEIIVNNFNPAKYEGLRINEFLANPIGSDSGEWIELYNNSSSTLDLFGFSLDDEVGGSKPYMLPASSTIPAFGYLTIGREKSKISLNNNQDKVRLLDPLQEIMQEISYVKAPEGETYNYNDLEDEWFWSKQISPNVVNVLDNPKIEVAASEQTATSTEEKIYSPTEILILDKGIKAKLKGVITAILNSVNARAVYVSTVDENKKVALEDGVQVYSTDSSLIKKLQVGDVVEFSGYVSESGGIKRLNLNKDSAVSIVGKVNLPDTTMFATTDVTDDLIGGLISVQGQMTEKKGNYFYLDDGLGEVKVVLKSFKINKDEIKEGDSLEVTGILTQSNGELRLMPRSKEDLTVSKVLGAQETATSSDQVVNLPVEDRKSQVLKYLSMLGGTILTIGLSLLAKLKFFHH